MLQFRRLASLLLGAWLAGSVLMDLTAIQNFRSVDRFLADPAVGAAQELHALGRDSARVLLRHFAAEQNRFYFEHWEWLELVLGFGLLLLFILGTRPPKAAIILTFLMFAIVLAQRAALTPQITRLGRIIDVVPEAVAGVQRQTFWTLHGIYSGVELLKIGLGVAVAAILLIRRHPDRQQFARESELGEFPAARPAR